MSATLQTQQATAFHANLRVAERHQLIEHLQSACPGDVVVLHVGRHHPLLLDDAWPNVPAIGPAIRAAVRRGAWVGFDGARDIEPHWYRWFARWHHTAVRETPC